MAERGVAFLQRGLALGGERGELRLQVVGEFRGTGRGFIAFFRELRALLRERGELGLLRLGGLLERGERGVLFGQSLRVLRRARLRLALHVFLFAGVAAGLLVLFLGQRGALLGEGGGFALLRFERLGQGVDLAVAFLRGFRLLFGQRGEFEFLLFRGVLEAAERGVAFLQRGLALGGEGLDLLAVRLLDLRDLRGGGLLFLQLAELGQRLVARLHRRGLLRAHGGEFLFVRLANRREFRLRLFLFRGERGLLLPGLRRERLLLLFPLLPARLQFVAFLDRGRAFLFEHLDALFILRPELFELSARGFFLAGFLRADLRPELRDRRGVLLQFLLQPADLRERLGFLFRRGTVRGFQSRHLLRARLEIPGEPHRSPGAAFEIRFHGRELRGEFVVLFPRRVALGERLFHVFGRRRIGVRRLAMPVAVGGRGLGAFDQADDRAAFVAHADGVAGADGLGALDGLFFVESAVGASEVAHHEVFGRDDDLRVLPRDAEAVEQDVARHVPADDVFARIEDVAPEGAGALQDDDFSLSSHKLFVGCAPWRNSRGRVSVLRCIAAAHKPFPLRGRSGLNWRGSA